MVVLPLSGWLSFAHFSADDLHGATLQAFGLFPLPIGPDLSSISRPVHGLGGKLGIALVILHVLAALKHQFITKDNLMSRMRLG
jgi:cytochrome b561